MNTIDLASFVDQMDELVHAVVDELELDVESNRYLFAFSDNFRMSLAAFELFNSKITIEKLLEEMHEIAIYCGGNIIGSNGLRLFRRYVQALREYLLENVEHGGSSI